VTRILDNIKGNELGKHLVATFEDGFERMDVAVGYFNLRGWGTFAPLVDNRPAGDDPVARVLIGMATGTAHREALDGLQACVDGRRVFDADGSTAMARCGELVEHLRTQLMRGLPTPDDRQTLQALRAQIKSGKVQVKVFTARPLHGKAYIFHKPASVNSPIVGFVGSSNLTYPGLTSNYELNVDVLDNQGAADLARWFEDRWNDRFSLDVTDDILDLIDESWAAPSPRRPYDVFLKLCYDLSRDVRDGLAEYSVPQQIAGTLLDYQTTAVRTLARRIMNRRGAMLGDVVGLGKTLTAIAVALMLRDEHGYQPLVLCPKNLQRMWEDHLEEYDLHGRVVPYSMAGKVLPELRRYPFVIADESHTLRNDRRQDYQAIRDYIQRNESKVLLLTATPFNIRFADVANQLALYVDDDDDLGIAPLNALREDPNIADSVDSKTTTLAAFRKSEDADDWKRLMSEHLVRRTRSFIESSYSKTDLATGERYLEFTDGSRFTFPSRSPRPVDHSFGPDDPATKMASDATLDAILSLKLPRYQLGQYVLRTVKPTDAELEFFDRVTRGRGHVAGFVRTTLYKRLSSCGFSFELSLRRHLARNDLWLHALSDGLPVPTGDISALSLDDDADGTLDGDAAGEADPGAAYEALRQSDPSGVEWVRAELFSGRLAADIAHDSAAIRELLDWYGPWTAGADSKLNELVRLLKVDHPQEKVLIFTEYQDTAVYLGKQLEVAGIAKVGVATGDSENPTLLAARFAPCSNGAAGERAVANQGELRVLVATDVLSEGQNLQDAHVVVNFDLPWAIIRLIQRAGRVDRIGQRSAEVVIYSFFHESVDNVISLRQRIGNRLAANAQAFGSDEQFFGSADETQIIEDLYNGKLDEIATDEDVDASSLAYQYWSQAVEREPELAKRTPAMPDMVDATRAKRLGEQADGVGCYVRSANGVDGFAFCGPGLAPRHLTGHEALALFRADPHEPGQPLREDHDSLVETMVRGDLTKAATASGRLRGVRKRVWTRLGEPLQPANTDDEGHLALEALYQHPLTGLAETRLRRAIRNGVSDIDLFALLGSLHSDGKLVIPTKAGEDPVRIITTMGVAP
jgi:superfamily II DNA or RNA helicase